MDEESLLAFTAIATDGDGNLLTFSLVDAPSGASIHPATGVFTWTPPSVPDGVNTGPLTWLEQLLLLLSGHRLNQGQSYSFTVKVSDGTATDSEKITINVFESSN